MIAGFITPDARQASVARQAVEPLPPFRRDLGLVFQDYALFPHMTVAENVGFGLRMRRVPSREIAQRVARGARPRAADRSGSNGVRRNFPADSANVSHWPVRW